MIASRILVGLVGALHLYFMTLEMFLWTKPKGLKTFGNTPAQAEATRVLAANQGLYNGFISAGLFWGILNPDPSFSMQIRVFFLICVIIAGAYGGYSVSRKIFYVQAVPAIIALALTFYAALYAS